MMTQPHEPLQKVLRMLSEDSECITVFYEKVKNVKADAAAVLV